MKWKKYTIHTTTAAEDYISAMLDGLGIEGVEIEDNVPLAKEDQADMFIDFLPELPPDDGKSRVSFYLEDNGDAADILQRVSESMEEWRQFVEIGEGTITVSETRDVDWMNNWKEYFHAFSIENILIKPTWEALKEEDADKLLIEIDPGISFGTGKHETTQLCIRQLIANIKKGAGQKVLDIGCGSGILSIAALKLGAAFVVGTDLDENCMDSTRENMKVNHLPEDAGEFYVGDLTSDPKLQKTVGEARYEIVVANILADVIIPMTSVIFSCLKPGGTFIASGIIDFKENEVRKAVEAAGMKVTEICRQGEWASVTAKKE